MAEASVEISHSRRSRVLESIGPHGQLALRLAITLVVSPQ